MAHPKTDIYSKPMKALAFNSTSFSPYRLIGAVSKLIISHSGKIIISLLSLSAIQQIFAVTSKTHCPLYDTEPGELFLLPRAAFVDINYAASIQVISNTNLHQAEYVFFLENHFNNTHDIIAAEMIAQLGKKGDRIYFEGAAGAINCSDICVNIDTTKPNAQDRKDCLASINYSEKFLCEGWEDIKLLEQVRAIAKLVNEEKIINLIKDNIATLILTIQKFNFQRNNNATFTLLLSIEFLGIIINSYNYLSEKNNSIYQELNQQKQQINDCLAFNDLERTNTKCVTTTISSIQNHYVKSTQFMQSELIRRLTQKNTDTTIYNENFNFLALAKERDSKGLIKTIFNTKSTAVKKFFKDGAEHLVAKKILESNNISVSDLDQDILESVSDKTYAFVFLKNRGM